MMSDDNVQPPGSLRDHISENVEGVMSLRRHEQRTRSPSQRRLEKISRIMGRPLYLVAILGFVSVWMIVNALAAKLGFPAIDPPPFQWLELLLSFVALVTTTIVLIVQNRQTKLEQQRAHLDLQVNLLTEQKVTKLIHLVEELRRDLPMVRDRHDQTATVLQESANTAQVVSALAEVGLTHDGDRPLQTQRERRPK